MRKIKSKTFHRHLRKREKKEQERILREGGGEEEKDEDEAAKAAIKRRAEDNTEFLCQNHRMYSNGNLYKRILKC